MIKIAKNFDRECLDASCNGCIYYGEHDEYCYKDELSATAKEICKSPLLIAYIHTLKQAYERYQQYRYKCDTNEDKRYYDGMCDSILATINDLGFGYLLYGYQ